MILRFLLAFTFVVLAISSGLAQRQQQRQLKDLLQLQRLQATGGQPLEDVGEPGQLRFAASAPMFFTSNANQSAGGGPSDFYFGPWVLGELTSRLGSSVSLHAGAVFTDYLYMRTPENNYSYAEVYTGLSMAVLQTEVTSLKYYANVFCDYDLTSNYTFDDVELGLSTGFTYDIKLVHEHTIYITPDFTIVRAYPEAQESNTYYAGTLTAGWNWQLCPAWTLGAYWSGSVSRYPFGDAENDFTQYFGVTATWEMTDWLSMVFSVVQTDNWSTELTSDYNDLTAGISLRTSLP
jgi:hypothetical protein